MGLLLVSMYPKTGGMPHKRPSSGSDRSRFSLGCGNWWLVRCRVRDPLRWVVAFWFVKAVQLKNIYFRAGSVTVWLPLVDEFPLGRCVRGQ